MPRLDEFLVGHEVALQTITCNFKRVRRTVHARLLDGRIASRSMLRRFLGPIDQELVDRKDALEIAPNREALMMALKGIGTT